MPKEGIKHLPHEAILRLEEIYDFTKVAVKLGIDKVRITGGEPLIRKGIINLLQMISSIEGIKDFSLTTNGFYLEEKAEDIKKAGINRLNISLDTLDPDKFKEITHGGDLNKVIRGILKAKDLGFNPIKLNVVTDNENDYHAQSVKNFAEQNNFEVRYIQLMNLSNGIYSKVKGGEGGNCSTCNRLRLTADGYLMPCLFSEIKYNIRELGFERALLLSIQNKPKMGMVNKTRCFFNIGG